MAEKLMWAENGVLEAECEAQGVTECRTRGGEMLPMLVVSWQASAVKGEEGGRFH